jgi:hypothetical protein
MAPPVRLDAGSEWTRDRFGHMDADTSRMGGVLREKPGGVKVPLGTARFLMSSGEGDQPYPGITISEPGEDQIVRN